MVIKKLSSERWFLLVICILAALAVIFMGRIVSPPKVLLGQMLTAITPSLFPTLTLSVLAALSGALFFVGTAEDSASETPDEFDANGLWRGIKLFACMLFYALSMELLGFFISSFITIILVSLLTGNKSALQIGGLALIGPVALYLTATRVLAVSLPELNGIELFYAQTLGL